jgi:hypothetical protein
MGEVAGGRSQNYLEKNVQRHEQKRTFIPNAMTMKRT